VKVTLSFNKKMSNKDIRKYKKEIIKNNNKVLFMLKFILSLLMAAISTFIFLIYDILGIPWFVGLGSVVGFIVLIKLDEK